MKTSQESSPYPARAALISIHPHHVASIMTGVKRVEFRRRWARDSVRTLVIYSTSPIARIVAICAIAKTTTGSRAKLWDVSRGLGAGISRSHLFDYLAGTSVGTAIELESVSAFVHPIPPSKIFGDSFRPPQSFRYMNEAEVERLNTYEKVKQWG